MTRAAYIALLDALLRAAQLEDAKAAEGEEAMARWARVAVPRWQAVSAQLTAAEAAQPAETWAWYLTWRQEKGLGATAAPGAAMAPSPAPPAARGAPLPAVVGYTAPQQVPSLQATAGVEQLTL